MIDWGSIGVGDPACDAMVAWKLHSPAARDVFREALPTDDATWERARGWALSQAVAILAYYTPENNPSQPPRRVHVAHFGYGLVGEHFPQPRNEGEVERHNHLGKLQPPAAPAACQIQNTSCARRSRAATSPGGST